METANALPLMERLIEQVVDQNAKVCAVLEAKLEKQQREIDKLREEVAEAKLQAAVQRVREEMRPQEAISDAQLSALQARLEALAAAQLLSDGELFACEDTLADFAEAKASWALVTMEVVHASVVVGRAHKMIALSEGTPTDTAFARQLRRKHVPK
jgi:predicted ATP-dependent protease